MVNFSQEDVANLKRVKFNNLSAMWKYLSIRYKVFVQELNRPIIGEFYKDDFFAQHYVLKGCGVIGTLRILYLKNKIAFIGRVAILSNYRNQGYGTLIINQAIELVKLHNQVNVVRLFAEKEKIGFYKKFGFIEQGNIYFNNIPYVQMSLTI